MTRGMASRVAALRSLTEAEIASLSTPNTYVSLGPLGYGLFAARALHAGDIIERFTGPTIGFDEAVAKGSWQCYPLQVGPGRYVDLDPPGCFANHSCSPNAGVTPKLDLVALRDISPEEEIRYDYSTTMDEDYWTMECLCESSGCRGRVTDFRHLPAHRRAYYLGMNVVQGFIRERTWNAR